MSYILDALHKAERKAPQGGLSPLEDLQELDDEDSGAAWKWGIGIAALVLVGTGVFFLGRMLGSGGDEAPPAVATIPSTPAAIPQAVPSLVVPPPPVATVAPAPAPAPVQPPPPQPVVAAPVAPAPIPQAASTAPVAAAAPSPSIESPVPKEFQDSSPSAAKVVAPAAPEEKPLPKPEPVAKSIPKPKPAPAAKASSLSWEDKAPLLMSMNYEYRALIPPIEVNVKVYSSVPEKRFVMLNMRRYREGDITQEGPVVEQIGPNSILFSYKGEVFQIAHP